MDWRRPAALALITMAAACGDADPPSRPVAGQSWTDPFSGIVFQYCPPGRFLMGTPEEDSFRVPDQMPRHEVVLTRGFWLGRSELTRAQWEGRTGALEAAAHAPMTGVSWEDCQDFLQRLNLRAGGERYRLPTEAEWEYACTAGTPPLPAFGPASDGPGVPYRGIGSAAHPHPWGLQAMVGSVREWCLDWGGPYPAGQVVDPQGPIAGRYRVHRGGSGGFFARHAHPTWRAYYTPNFQDGDLGLRVVRIAE